MASVTLQEIWAEVEANRAKPRKTISVSFDMEVPADASDADIAEYLRYELWGGMLRAHHPLLGIPTRAEDADTIKFNGRDDASL